MHHKFVISAFGFPLIESEVNKIGLSLDNYNLATDKEISNLFEMLHTVCRENLWFYPKSVNNKNYSDYCFYLPSNQQIRGISELYLALKVHLSSCEISTIRHDYPNTYVVDFILDKFNVDQLGSNATDLMYWVPSIKIKNVKDQNHHDDIQCFELTTYPLKFVNIDDSFKFNFYNTIYFTESLKKIGINDIYNELSIIEGIEKYYFDNKNILIDFPLLGTPLGNAKIIFLHLFLKVINIKSESVSKYLANKKILWDDKCIFDHSFFISYILALTLKSIDEFFEFNDDNKKLNSDNSYNVSFYNIDYNFDLISYQSRNVQDLYNEYLTELVETYEVSNDYFVENDDVEYSNLNDDALVLDSSNNNYLFDEQDHSIYALEQIVDILNEFLEIYSYKSATDKAHSLNQGITSKLLDFDINSKNKIAHKNTDYFDFDLDSFNTKDYSNHSLPNEISSSEANNVLLNTFKVDSKFSKSNKITNEPDDDEDISDSSSNQLPKFNLIQSAKQSIFSINEIESILDISGIEEYVNPSINNILVKPITSDAHFSLEQKKRAVLELNLRTQQQVPFYPRITDKAAWKILSRDWLQYLIFIRTFRFVDLPQVNKATYFDLMALRSDILNSWNDFNSGYLQKRYLDEISFEVFSTIYSSWEYRQYMNDIVKKIIYESRSIKRLKFYLNLYTNELVQADKLNFSDNERLNWVEHYSTKVDALLPEESIKYEVELRNLFNLLKDKLKTLHNDIYGETNSSIDIFKIMTVVIDQIAINTISNNSHPLDIQEFFLKKISDFIYYRLDNKTLNNPEQKFAIESFFSETKAVIRKRKPICHLLTL